VKLAGKRFRVLDPNRHLALPQIGRGARKSIQIVCDPIEKLFDLQTVVALSNNIEAARPYLARCQFIGHAGIVPAGTAADAD
jgi:hypothetical protein